MEQFRAQWRHPDRRSHRRAVRVRHLRWVHAEPQRTLVAASYTVLASPRDAFQAVQELGFTLALDDSEWLQALALLPYGTLAIETGSNGSDGPGRDDGTYLELGIAPGLSFDVSVAPVSLSFSASMGLSRSNHYRNAAGGDNDFGFAQVGSKASIPLGESDQFGQWTLSAGVSVLLRGDGTKSFHNDDSGQVIGTIGLQWNFSLTPPASVPRFPIGLFAKPGRHRLVAAHFAAGEHFRPSNELTRARSGRHASLA